MAKVTIVKGARIVALTSLAVLGLTATPTQAGPKPITKTYTATAPLPDPTNFASFPLCAGNVPMSRHLEPFKAPAAGKLVVKMTGFSGDWDLVLHNDKGGNVAEGGGSGVANVMTGVENLTYKIKKPQTITIVACNWAGGPTASVTYTFTYG